MGDERKAYLARAGDVIAACGALQNACKELQAASERCAPGAGGYPGYAGRLMTLVDLTLRDWQGAEPDAFGLKAAETSKERALREAEASLKLAKQRFQWAKDILRRQDAPEKFESRVTSYQAGIAFWERRIRFLRGEPEPEPKPPTMSDVDDLAMRMGSFEKARRALGLPTKEPEAYPPIPTLATAKG